MEHLKRDIAWTARGELIHEGVPVAGSNVVDIENVLLCKRKTDPTGWQSFARQLRATNLPMELIGNVARRAYIRHATTTTTPATPRAGAVVREDHSVELPSVVGAFRWNIPCSPHLQNDNARLWCHWLVGKTFKAVRYVSIAHCALR